MKMKTQIKKFFEDVRDHRNSNLAEFQWESCGHEPITRWMEIREWWSVLGMHLRYQIGALVCKYFGHSHNVEVEDFVAAEYVTGRIPEDGDEDPTARMVDIHGGGCDWHCPRCGMGGRNWF